MSFSGSLAFGHDWETKHSTGQIVWLGAATTWQLPNSELPRHSKAETPWQPYSVVWLGIPGSLDIPSNLCAIDIILNTYFFSGINYLEWSVLSTTKISEKYREFNIAFQTFPRCFKR